LRLEVVQEGLLADADGLRDRLERCSRVALAPELADGLLDDRGLPALAARPGHLVPRLGPAAPRDGFGALPRPSPRGPAPSGERRRLALLRPRDRLEPRRAILVENLR